MTTPRVFIIRHGETEWSLNGRHTGTTELPLTENGERRIRATGRALVGDDRLIIPKSLAHVYVSPRFRAKRTVELLGLGTSYTLPWKESRECDDASVRCHATVEVTEDAREWDYGDYEGMTAAAIRQQRKERGEGGWDIWKDGCPGGESEKDVTERVDRLIKEIRSRFHANVIGKPVADSPPSDVLVVAHGHILRSFAARWVGKPINTNPQFILEAGGVGTLSYEHHSIDEPALMLGGAFMANIGETSMVEK